MYWIILLHEILLRKRISRKFRYLQVHYTPCWPFIQWYVEFEVVMKLLFTVKWNCMQRKTQALIVATYINNNKNLETFHENIQFFYQQSSVCKTKNVWAFLRKSNKITEWRQEAYAEGWFAFENIGSD